jgi:hypothetical protein
MCQTWTLRLTYMSKSNLVHHKLRPPKKFNLSCSLMQIKRNGTCFLSKKAVLYLFHLLVVYLSTTSTIWPQSTQLLNMTNHGLWLNISVGQVFDYTKSSFTIHYHFCQLWERILFCSDQPQPHHMNNFNGCNASLLHWSHFDNSKKI